MVSVEGVVSAPLYDSTTQRFSGMFTLADVVHLIQYYYLTQNDYENVIAEVEGFQLESLRRELNPSTSLAPTATHTTTACPPGPGEILS